MSAPSSVGFGLYFIDVLACLLFCLTLALVGARFGREQTVAVELPRMEAADRTGPDLAARTIALRSEGDALEIFLGDTRVSLEELEARLRREPPASVVVRAEESSLARVIAIAHGAGVHDIQLAYALARAGEGSR
jgi:biopolymer transport protein ExbD